MIDMIERDKRFIKVYALVEMHTDWHPDDAKVGYADEVWERAQCLPQDIDWERSFYVFVQCADPPERVIRDIEHLIHFHLEHYRLVGGHPLGGKGCTEWFVLDGLEVAFRLMKYGKTICMFSDIFSLSGFEYRVREQRRQRRLRAAIIKALSGHDETPKPQDRKRRLGPRALDARALPPPRFTAPKQGVSERRLDLVRGHRGLFKPRAEPGAAHASTRQILDSIRERQE